MHMFIRDLNKFIPIHQTDICLLEHGINLLLHIFK